MQKPLRVRVILVNYRSLENVRRRLESEALAQADVVVVDNASDPVLVSELCRRHGATPVLLPNNRGFAAGVNAAWRLVREREPLPLLLLNPDAELTEAVLGRLLEDLTVPGTTGVAPLLVEESGRLQVGAGGGPLSLGSAVAYFLFGAHVLHGWRGIFLTRTQSARAGRVEWLCMASLLLCSDALDRFGELPEDELVYAEDVAWGTSASSRGAVLRLVPDVAIRHPHGSSGSSEAWVGSLTRLLRRRLGPVHGAAAISVIHAGLWIRRLLGREVTAP